MGRMKPKQDRGLQAERKILAAAQQVFAEKGFAGARVADIVKLAESSTGNFYFRFKNKEALFEHMLEQFLVNSRLAATDVSPEVDNIVELIAWLVARNAQQLNANIGFYRAVNEVSIRHPDTWLRLRTLSEEIGDLMVEYSRDYLTEIPGQYPEVRLRQAINLITGHMANQAIHHPDRQIDDATSLEVNFRAGLGILGMGGDQPMPSIKLTPLPTESEDNA